jgi:hypothetical protein
MDPTETLAQLLRDFASWHKNQQTGYGLLAREAQARAFEDLDALREWLSNAGFPPDPLEAIRRAHLDDLGS